MKPHVMIGIVICVLAACCLFPHRRVIGALIRHEPTPKAQKWHCKEELKPAENDKKEAVSLGGGRYKCPCGYLSDPAKGNPKQNISAGTQFENFPDDWRCPRCKRKKE